MRGARFEPESQRTARGAGPFANLAELRVAYETMRTLGTPVLAYKTFGEYAETLAEGLPERTAREISLGNRLLDGINICNGRCKHYGE